MHLLWQFLALVALANNPGAVNVKLAPKAAAGHRDLLHGMGSLKVSAHGSVWESESLLDAQVGRMGTCERRIDSHPRMEGQGVRPL